MSDLAIPFWYLCICIYASFNSLSHICIFIGSLGTAETVFVLLSSQVKKVSNDDVWFDVNPDLNGTLYNFRNGSTVWRKSFFSLFIFLFRILIAACALFVHIFFHNWLHFNWLKCGFTYAIWQIKINSPTRLNKAEQNKSSRYFAHHKLPTRDKRGALCLSLSSMQSLEILSIPFSPLIKRRVSVTFNLPYYSNNFTLACGSTAKAQTIVKRKEEKNIGRE